MFSPKRFRNFNTATHGLANSNEMKNLPYSNVHMKYRRNISFRLRDESRNKYYTRGRLQKKYTFQLLEQKEFFFLPYCCCHKNYFSQIHP